MGPNLISRPLRFSWERLHRLAGCDEG